MKREATEQKKTKVIDRICIVQYWPVLSSSLLCKNNYDKEFIAVDMQNKNEMDKNTPFAVLAIVELCMLIPWYFGYENFPHSGGLIGTIVSAPFRSYPILVVLGFIVAKKKLDRGKETFAVMISLFPLFILLAWVPLMMFGFFHITESSYFPIESKISDLKDEKAKTTKHKRIANQKNNIIGMIDVPPSEVDNGSCYLPIIVYKKDDTWKVESYVDHATGFGKSVNNDPGCIKKQIEMEKLYIEHIVGKKK